MSLGNYFCDGTHQWDAPTLWEAAADPTVTYYDFRPEELLKKGCFSDFTPLLTFQDSFEYFQRVMAADLHYPIIVRWVAGELYILDGFHRTMKALLNKEYTIQAVRLDEMPPPDRKANCLKHDCAGCPNV